MNCTDAQKKLGTMMDGDLPVESDADLRKHLEACPRCSEYYAELRAAVRHISSLPESIEPPRDLWPSIEQRLARRSRNIVPFKRLVPLAAAACLIISLSVLIIGFNQKSGDTALLKKQARIAALQADLKNMDEEYRVLRQSINAAYFQGFLPDSTIQIIQANMSLIDRSTSEIKSALLSNSGNVDLFELCLARYKSEISILQRTAVLITAPKGVKL